MTRRLLSGALALALTPVLGGVAPASTGKAAAFRTKVRIVDFRFKRQTVEIPQGTKVTWTNRSDQAHTSSSRKGLWDSGQLAPGASFTRKFRKTGVFRYQCNIHPEMRGKVIVGDV